MYSIRVGSELADRIDAEFYNPEALAAINQIKKVGDVSTLGAEISEGYRVVYHGTDSVNHLKTNQKLGFLSPAHISKDGEIDFDSVDQLPLYYKDDYPKGLGKSGELLIEVKGNVSKVAVLPASFPQNLMISGSLYKAHLSSNVDAHYTLAFLKSKHGQLLKNRLTSNTIINYIGKDALYSIPLLLVDLFAQKYIGDKIRHAEKLRTWATSIITEVTSFHSRFIPPQSALDFSKKTRTVASRKMTERLDAHFYPAVVEDYIANSDVNFLTMKSLCFAVFNGQTQAETSTEKSIFQITVTNLSQTFIKGNSRVVLEPATKSKQTQKHDLFICNAAHNKSYIGRDITYNHSENVFLPSTEVMVIRVNTERVPASYIRSFLMSKLGFIEIQSTIRGITAHSYPVDVEKLEIPIPNIENELRVNWFACDDKMVQAGLACEIATKLTLAARNLIEDLIEGEITEQQLIIAQQTLESGDDSLDRLLLSRIKSDGLDTNGEPLFSDLDQLYELLAQSQQFTENH
jgi:type I restriction enzyme S subunit